MSKNKGRNRKAVEQALEPQPPTILVAWNEYFQTGSLGDWQRLMQNLGFQEEFTSKSQCRRVCNPPAILSMASSLYCASGG